MKKGPLPVLISKQTILTKNRQIKVHKKCQGTTKNASISNLKHCAFTVITGYYHGINNLQIMEKSCFILIPFVCLVI